MLHSLNRREMFGLSGRSLLASWLAIHAHRAGYAADSAEPRMQEWADELDTVSQRLTERKISPLEWQEAVDSLYRSVPMESLLAMIDFRRLADQLTARDLGKRGEIFTDISLGPIPKTTNEAAAVSAIVKVAHVKKGKSIPPHGHSSMVSAFLCISGEFDVRLYDRLDDLGDELIVRQSVDQKDAGPGSWSSISDYRDNVHWLTAKSDDCFLFTCKLIRLEPDRAFHGRINLNMRDAKSLGSNTWRAAKISGLESFEIH
jgi:hypothetical protein